MEWDSMKPGDGNRKTGPAFLEFCEGKLIDYEDAAARGEPGMESGHPSADAWRAGRTRAIISSANFSGRWIPASALQFCKIACDT